MEEHMCLIQENLVCNKYIKSTIYRLYLYDL